MDRLELPQGTLDLLILKIVALQPQHGWAISERLHQISSAILQFVKARFTLPFIDWSDAGGSRRDGEPPITIAVRNITN